MRNTLHTEQHPLEPFLPQNASILMLGSFPPPRARWSMEFYYPNWINDMWRIFGYIFYNDKHYFEIRGEKSFDKEKIVEFCNGKGIALFDTACEVIRQKENAADKFLEVVTPTDIPALLQKIPHCTTIVTTGQKAADTICSTFGSLAPATGSRTTFCIAGREIELWRLPSSSRAYPMTIEKKAEAYRNMFKAAGILQ